MKKVVLICLSLCLLLYLYSYTSLPEVEENLSDKVAIAILNKHDVPVSSSDFDNETFTVSFIVNDTKYLVSSTLNEGMRILEINFSNDLQGEIYDQNFVYGWSLKRNAITKECIVSDFFNQSQETIHVQFEADIQQCRTHLETIAEFYSVL